MSTLSLSTTPLSFRWKGGKALNFPAIALDAGSPCLVLGPSGCGKTTLLHMIAGLLPPQTGKISILGTEITSLSRRECDRFRGKNIGIVFQKALFIASLSISQNLMLAQSLAGAKQDATRISQLAERLHIASCLNKKPEALSIGEQQRAGIARALVNKPGLILADEPSSSLDDRNTETVIGMLEEQAALEGAALLIITHDNRLKSRFGNQIQL